MTLTHRQDKAQDSGGKRHTRKPGSKQHTLDGQGSTHSAHSQSSTSSEKGKHKLHHHHHHKQSSKHHKGKKKKKKKKKNHHAADLGEHATLADKKHADAAEARAAIVAQQREVLVKHHVPVLLLSARAINRQRFAKNAGAKKRTAAPGPRPTDLPPRLKPGFRYTEGGLPDVYGGILGKDLAMVRAYLVLAKNSDGITVEAKEKEGDVYARPEVDQRLGTFPNGTLLHLAAQHSSVEMVVLLLNHGAHIHAVDDLGNTPLHRAVKTGNANMVKVLLKQKPTEVGQLLSTRNVDGLTALQIAIQFGFEKIRSLFINHLKLSGKKLSNSDRAFAGMLAQHEEELRKVRTREDKHRQELQEAE